MGAQQSDVQKVNLIEDHNNNQSKYQNFNLEEFAKPDQPYNVQMPQIPQHSVLLKPNNYQIMLPSSNQNQQFRQAKLQSTKNTILLKDLNFKIQIQQTKQSLFVLVVHQICLFICFVNVLRLQEHYVNEYSHIFLLLFVPLYIVSLCLSNSNFFRRQPFPLILFISNIFLASEVLFFFCSYYSNEIPLETDGLYITSFGIAYLACFLLIIFNTVDIGIIMIYLCLEKQKVQLRIIAFVLGGIYFLLFVSWFYFYPIAIASYLYGIGLLISIQQSLKGRFKLKQGEILSAANSYNFGIIFPIQL